MDNYFKQQLQLKVDTAEELFNSVLFWKHVNQSEPQMVESFKQENDMVYFEIQKKKKNKQNIGTKIPKNFKKKIIDLLTSLEINYKTSREHQLQTSTLYFECNQKQVALSCNQQELFHIGINQNEVNFILETQINENQIKVIKFCIQLKQLQFKSNKYLFQIEEEELNELTNFNGKNFQFKQNKLIPHIKSNQIKTSQELILKTCEEILEGRDEFVNIIIQQTEKIKQSLEQTLIIKNNFFKQQKVNEVLPQYFDENIFNTFDYPVEQKQTIKRLNSSRLIDLKKNEQIRLKKKEQDRKIGQIQKLQEENSANVDEQQDDDQVENKISEILQPQIIENIPNLQKLIKEYEELKKQNEDYQETVNSLNLKIVNLNFTIKNLKEENQRLKNKLNRHNQYRNHRFYDPRHYNQLFSKSTTDLFLKNPTPVQQARQEINLEECQMFQVSIDQQTSRHCGQGDSNQQNNIDRVRPQTNRKNLKNSLQILN